MKCTFGGWSWQLVVIVMLLTGSLFADPSAAILYPGYGTTVNGKAVYYSALLVAGDQVQTATAAGGEIAVGGMDLGMAPNTIVVMGEPLVLNCGTVVVRSGTAKINDGGKTANLIAGESYHAASLSCGGQLPDAPSAVRGEQNLTSSLSVRRSRRRDGAPPPATSGFLYVDFKVANWPYRTLTGAMIASSLTSVDLTQRCLHAGACSFVPEVFRSRAAMYGAGLPAAAGVSYLSYYLKRKGYRWWFVPAALVTAGNVVVSTHAAHYSH